MKLFKNILEQLLSKKKFFYFTCMDKIFKKIFVSYVDSVVFIRIKNRILFIGVKIPQLVAHFTALKKHILNQFLEETDIDIIDIKFFYYNQPKNMIEKKTERRQIIKNQCNSEEHKKDVYMLIEKKCYKKEYHDILYQLYIKSCLYGKR
jgi:hypothetical protein